MFARRFTVSRAAAAASPLGARYTSNNVSGTRGTSASTDPSADGGATSPKTGGGAPQNSGSGASKGWMYGLGIGAVTAVYAVSVMCAEKRIHDDDAVSEGDKWQVQGTDTRQRVGMSAGNFRESKQVMTRRPGELGAGGM
jgi:hypothetical protein